MDIYEQPITYEWGFGGSFQEIFQKLSLLPPFSLLLSYYLKLGYDYYLGFENDSQFIEQIAGRHSIKPDELHRTTIPSRQPELPPAFYTRIQFNSLII